jgi:hypothetical protein
MFVRKKLWPVIVLGVLVAGYLAYRYLLTTMTMFNCNYNVLSEQASPDGRYISTVSERECGATTTYSRVVSVRLRGAAFDGDDATSWAFVISDQPKVTASWSGKRQLTILPNASGGTQERQRWQDVSIEVRQVP